MGKEHDIHPLNDKVMGLVQPLSDYLANNFNPYYSIVIDAHGARLICEEATQFTNSGQADVLV